MITHVVDGCTFTFPDYATDEEVQRVLRQARAVRGQVKRTKDAKRWATMPGLPSRAAAAKRIDAAIAGADGWSGDLQVREVAGSVAEATVPVKLKAAARRVAKLIDQGWETAERWSDAVAGGKLAKVPTDHVGKVVAACLSKPLSDQSALDLHYGYAELERRWLDAERKARIRYGISDPVERAHHQYRNGLLTAAERDRRLDQAGVKVDGEWITVAEARRRLALLDSVVAA